MGYGRWGGGSGGWGGGYGGGGGGGGVPSWVDQRAVAADPEGFRRWSQEYQNRGGGGGGVSNRDYWNGGGGGVSNPEYQNRGGGGGSTRDYRSGGGGFGPQYGGGAIGGGNGAPQNGPPPIGPGDAPQYDWNQMQNPMAGAFPNTGQWGEIGDWKGTTGEARERMISNYLLLNEQGFNQGAWGAEFGEGNRRWGMEYDAARQNDRFSQGLADRQFGLSERQVNIGEDQWNRRFGQEQKQWDQSYGLQRDQFGENQRQFNTQFGENQRQFDTQFGESRRQFDTSFGENQRQFDTNTQQRGLDRESQLTQARYGAFGRAQAPNARMARSW